MILCNVLNKEELSREEMIFLLGLEKPEEIKLLLDKADDIRRKYVSDEVHLRGIINFSNFCEQNCQYCALREDNFSYHRYRMPAEEIIETAKVISNEGISNVLLQSGHDSFYDSDMISYIIYSIKQKADVSVTLSLGARRFDEYRAWKIAGADRYLLKYETSNEKLYYEYYGKQHLNERIQHLKFLKQIGYQVASGSLIGLPHQTIEDIADNIILCKDLEVTIAMISPFIPASFTPYKNQKAGSIELTLKAIAVTRLFLKNANIPATNSLDEIDNRGKEKGLNSGANLVLSDFTPIGYKDTDHSTKSKKTNGNDPIIAHKALQSRIEAMGRRVSTIHPGNPTTSKIIA